MIIPAKIFRSGRKTIAVTVNNRAEIIVRAPYGVSCEVINETVFRKRKWIEEKQNIAETFFEKYPESSFKVGECHMFLGNYYMLDYAEISSIILDGNKILVSQNRQKDVRGLLKNWYKEQALSLVKERVDYYANKMGEIYSELCLSDARKRWGSCGANRKIYINWRIIMCPQFVIDYVVIHELSHLKYKNHNTEFLRRVATIMPDYKQAQCWLLQNGGLLNTY